MKKRHTKEPWVAVSFNEGHYVKAHASSLPDVRVGFLAKAIDRPGFRGCSGEANAKHIVSCVNGCAGINPDAVPDLLVALQGIADLCGELGGGAHPQVARAVQALHKAQEGTARMRPVYGDYTGSDSEGGDTD